MSIFFEKRDHQFEAEINIYPLGPETRSTHPFNGIRWAFAYANDLKDDGSPREVFDIWPEFIDKYRNSIPTSIPLVGKLNAKMHIVFLENAAYHMQRLDVGTKFYCTEGARKCTEGIVTSICG